ncbi:MAG: GNAT family N-acetyltransferase [Bdellovibrionales bacterium]|nr:GNAT family N-acetyltransferase [Bdellovibrionales bacterium]
MELEPVTLAQSDVILSIFESSPSYFQHVDGTTPTLKTVQDTFANRPKQTIPEYGSEFLLLRKEGRPVGLCELHVHHPERGIVYLGLLLLREDCCGRGWGREAYELVERYLQTRHACRRIRLGVSDDNDVSGFWSRVGFKANGRSYTWMGERKANHVVEYEKTLPETAVHA